MRPSNNFSDEIELEYIEISPKYAREYPIKAYTGPVDLNIGIAAGFVDTMARNDAGTFVSRKRYAIVFGGLVPIASAETDPETISVSAFLSGTTIIATVTGNSGSKNLTIGHALG